MKWSIPMSKGARLRKEREEGKRLTRLQRAERLKAREEAALKEKKLANIVPKMVKEQLK